MVDTVFERLGDDYTSPIVKVKIGDNEFRKFTLEKSGISLLFPVPYIPKHIEVLLLGSRH